MRKNFKRPDIRAFFFFSASAIFIAAACAAPRPEQPARRSAAAENPPASAMAPAAPSATSAAPPSSLPGAVVPSLSSPAPAAGAPAAPCFNTQYQFTCALPKGYIITDEGEGPGAVMTLSQTQVLSSMVPASLSVKIYPLRKFTLERYIDAHITRDLSTSTAVAQWDKGSAAYGAYQGVEVRIDRRYASGEFKTKIFAFAEKENVVLIYFTAPVDTFDKTQTALADFISTLVFSP